MFEGSAAQRIKVQWGNWWRPGPAPRGIGDRFLGVGGGGGGWPRAMAPCFFALSGTRGGWPNCQVQVQSRLAYLIQSNVPGRVQPVEFNLIWWSGSSRLRRWCGYLSTGCTEIRSTRYEVSSMRSTGLFIFRRRGEGEFKREETDHCTCIKHRDYSIQCPGPLPPWISCLCCTHVQWHYM